MTSPQMTRVKVNDIEINLAIWEGQGEPVLCIHGLTANCRCWCRIAEALIPSYTIMAVDLRGRGLSGKPTKGYSLYHHRKDICGILDALNIERIRLMGHSLGAVITLSFAAFHPDRVKKIVLVDGAGDLDKEQMDRVFIGIKPSLDRLSQTYSSKEEYLKTMKASPYIQPWSSYLEAYYEYEITEAENGRLRTNINKEHILEEAANLRKVDCRTLYPKVKCQTLILRATRGLVDEKDLLLPEDVIHKMTSEISNAVIFDVEGTNHYGVIFQAHEKRDHALLGFLQDE